MYAERDTDSYGKLIGEWIDKTCRGETSGTAWEKFCSDAHNAGLWSAHEKDPFGITDFVHCVSKGHDCGSFAIDLASDALMAVPGAGEADEAALAARTEAAVAANLGEDTADGILDAIASGCITNSFPGSTKILRGDGTSTTPIQDIHVGDTVEATNPLTGETRPEKVQAVIKTLTDTDFTDITVTGGSGTHTLTSTQHHPYWDVTRSRWTDATDLHPGDALRLPNGHLARIRTVRDYTGHIVTYNLTVTDLHTYYVLAGATPVLVHNTGPGCGGIADVWHAGTFDSPEASFQYHFNKHGAPVNVTPEQYLQDSKDWAARLAQPGGKAGLNAKRMPFDDGKFGVKYADPNGGMGGIIGPDGKVVSFWYSDAH